MDDEKMREMAESVSQHGVLVPGIVRRRPEGGYELVSGHRRKRACELAGLPAMRDTPIQTIKYLFSFINSVFIIVTISLTPFLIKIDRQKK